MNGTGVTSCLFRSDIPSHGSVSARFLRCLSHRKHFLRHVPDASLYGAQQADVCQGGAWVGKPGLKPAHPGGRAREKQATDCPLGSTWPVVAAQVPQPLEAHIPGST